MTAKLFYPPFLNYVSQTRPMMADVIFRDKRKLITSEIVGVWLPICHAESNGYIFIFMKDHYLLTVD